MSKSPPTTTIYFNISLIGQAPRAYAMEVPIDRNGIAEFGKALDTFLLQYGFRRVPDTNPPWEGPTPTDSSDEDEDDAA